MSSRIGLRLVICFDLLAINAVAFAQDIATKCSGLKGERVFNGMATVTDAKIVELKRDFEYCVARAEFTDSGLQIEVRLPSRNWNGRLLYLGGGGFNGSIWSFRNAPEFFSPSMIDERYAVMAGNGGYDGPGNDDQAGYFRAEFAYDAVKLMDFMFQSVHRALPVGKEVVRIFYGSMPTRDFFEGCSTGGHEALIEAQRFPKDFDGIVARAPAGNFVGLYTQFHRIATHVRTQDGLLNQTKRDLLAHAVLARCDASDGLADGILSRPQVCDFDPRTLGCSGGRDTGDTCLSDAQIATVAAVTTPYAAADGSVTHAGYNFGGENIPDGWGTLIWPQDTIHGDTYHGLFSDAFIRSFVTRDPAYDTKAWDPNQWLPVIHLINELFQAVNPDLSALSDRGGKVILWNGEIDTSVSPRETAQYYDRVVQTMGRQKADRVVELFLAPGVGHCMGGPGPDRVDLLKAVATWVERGTPPSQQNLLHTKLDKDGKVIAARPLCKYPSYARYKGSGDAKDPKSFTCVL
jgi:hypothetical protein